MNATISNNPIWIIYGANGYTGELIAEEAVQRGYTPILAGRRKDSVNAVAERLNLDYRIFDLENKQTIQQNIQDAILVLHCAGPFSKTAAPMMDACLASNTHYLDITGEIEVFERAQNLHQAAQTAGVVVCPGVGFDVIPTDCVAAALKKALPDAHELSLGFDSRSGMSPGTAKTSVEGMAMGGKVRQDGELKSVPLAYEVRHIDFGNGEKSAMTIPWGDVSTAYHSTGIPNIRVFIPGSEKMIKNAKMANKIRFALGWTWVQNFLKKRIDKSIKGPSQKTRDKQPTYVWGEAKNQQGTTKTARIKVDNGYSLTVTGSLSVVEYLLGQAVSGGAYTPSKLVGDQLITNLPNSGELEIC